MEKEIDIIVEIPAGSSIKYEWDEDKKAIRVDRILRDGFVYPANYGFIENTLDWDGDPLDVLVFTPEIVNPGTIMKVRILGAMKMIDDGETDTKLIAVHADDYRLENVITFDDLPTQWLKDIENFFSTYKNWKKPGITSVPGFESVNWALAELEECKAMYQKFGNSDKKAFIKQMKKEHPEKYFG